MALMLSIGEESDQLPNLEHVKAYLADYSGQAAALTGFINFLNENYGISIDYLKLKKSSFLKTKQKKKLEMELVALTQTDLSDNELILSWVRNGLRYFHQLPYIDALKIKTEMITEIEDGYDVRFNGHSYWLPKPIELQKNS